MKPDLASAGGVSLRSALIRRLTIALALIGALGTVVAYLLGSSYTSIAYDRALADDVLTLAEQTTSTAAGVQVSLPDPALKWLLANEGESTFYRVTDLRNGAVVTSNGNLDTSTVSLAG